MKIFNLKNLVLLGAGAAAGYLLSNRDRRQQALQTAQQTKDSVQQFWQDPETQRQVHQATGAVTDAVKDRAPALADMADKAANLIDQSTGYNAEADGEANSPNAQPGNEKAGHETVTAHGDTVSDPSQSLEEEGGTTATRG